LSVVRLGREGSAQPKADEPAGLNAPEGRMHPEACMPHAPEALHGLSQRSPVRVPKAKDLHELLWFYMQPQAFSPKPKLA